MEETLKQILAELKAVRGTQEKHSKSLANLELTTSGIMKESRLIHDALID